MQGFSRGIEAFSTDNAVIVLLDKYYPNFIRTVQSRQRRMQPLQKSWHLNR